MIDRVAASVPWMGKGAETLSDSRPLACVHTSVGALHEVPRDDQHGADRVHVHRPVDDDERAWIVLLGAHSPSVRRRRAPWPRRSLLPVRVAVVVLGEVAFDHVVG